MSRGFRAVIVAAGLGRRCVPFTKEIPKCLLTINGKTILGHQLDALGANGITSVAVVRGHLAEKIDLAGLRYYDNIDYRKNNVLNSLMIAEQELEGNCLITYGDIVYTDRVVRTALQSRADLAIVVDAAWRRRYEGRWSHPISEAEKVIVDRGGAVARIGKHLEDGSAIAGEFIGMLKLTGRGCDLFRAMFHQAKTSYEGRPFGRSETFREAYLSDLLQEMIQSGVLVETVTIQGDWVEVDTAQDYDYANRMFKTALTSLSDSEAAGNGLKERQF